MAIIIPSKNIYEINNQKVVDNEVDSIEVNAKNVVKNNNYKEPVYDKNVFDEALFSKSDEKQSVGAYIVSQPPHEGEAGIYQEIVVYAALQAGYTRNIKIVIPKRKENTRVDSIYNLIDKNGDANISYSVSYQKIQYSAKGKFYSGTSNHSPSESSSYVTDIELSQIEEPETEVGSISTEDEIKLDNERTEELQDGGGTAKTSVSIKNESNLKTAEYTEDINNFYLTLTIISYLKKLKMSRIGFGISPNSMEEPRDISGECEEYVPVALDVTIYGNTTSIDLQDETVKIGDGQHVYSFNGNEIIQTNNRRIISNYGISILGLIKEEEGYSYYRYIHDFNSSDLQEGDIVIYQEEEATAVRLEVSGSSIIAIKARSGCAIASLSGVLSTTICTVKTSSVIDFYNKIIDDWKNGKETAEILCAISDYYYDEPKEETKKIIVDEVITRSPTQSIISFHSNNLPPLGYIESFYVTILSQEYEVKNLSSSISGNIVVYSGRIDLSSESIQQYAQYNAKYKKTIAISANNSYFPITIPIGETVIPYIMGTDKKEKPMSLYTDRVSPKQFRVIGKGIQADGQILQKITLQEIPQKQ